jgi:uncharacterized protein (UPF0262 family)
MDGGGDDIASTGQDPHPRSIVKIQLDEKSFLRRRPEVEHEREVALFDLLEENEFVLKGEGVSPGPYYLKLKLADDRLVFDLYDTKDVPLREIVMPAKPFRSVIKDYFMICESYFDAIKASSPSQIEAIDMGRRGLHNEGAQMLKEKLEAEVEMDKSTSRRFFTLLCVLHMRG